jgi:hypothetical protein
MIGRKRAAALAIAAVAAVAVAVSAGLALADVTCTLSAMPSAAHYGQDVVLQPTVTTSTVPGDQFTIQNLVAGEWVTYGEGLAVEDTDTIVPQDIVVDGSITYPATFRTVFKPKSSANTTAAISDPVTVSLVRNTGVRVRISAPKSMKRNRVYAVSAAVTPVSGEGNLDVKVFKTGRAAALRSYTVMTNEFGEATTKLALKDAGNYRIQMKWRGNVFGASSVAALANVTVR